jgi:glutaredoxin
MRLSSSVVVASRVRGPAPSARWPAALVVLAVVLIGAACGRRGEDAGAPGATAASDQRADDEAPPSPVVRDEATNLLFSFVDAHGRVQTVPRVDAVPEPVRQRVLVIDLDKTPEQRQAHRFAFFADLTTKAPDGTYSVVAVSRYDAARTAGGPAVAPPTDGTVIVYSATWCGFCKKAKAWLKQNGVPYVERDVEKTAGAQAELDAKLRSASVPGGGIPVIDWAGTLVVGFDVPSLQRLLQDKPPRTADDEPAGAVPGGDAKDEGGAQRAPPTRAAPTTAPPTKP